MRYRSSQGFSLGLIGYLIITNLVLYIATSVQSRMFIDTFGLTPIDFWSQPWTIITNMFIHSPFPDFWHILANMLTLYFFGGYLIQLIRETNFLIVYLIGGIVGNIAYLLFPANPYATAIGASGAVFAVGGALTVLRPNIRVIIFPIPVPLPLWVAVIGGFFLLTLLTISSPSLHIAWQAHLGGLVFGMVMGFLWRRRRRYFY